MSRGQTTLTGRVAIVTGAGRGIGRAIALGLARAGADVAVIDRSPAQADAVARELGDVGAQAIACCADVSVEAEIERAIAESVRALGAPWVLVNAAGIGPAVDFLDMTAAQWREVHSVNLDGTFYASREAARIMVSAGVGGRIINVGSQIAMKGAAGLAHYVSSKAAVHGFTRALARELAPHAITVNTIAPGPVETDMLLNMPADWLESERAEMPLGRFGRVEEIAPMAVLLASVDGGGFITGALLNVSGGDVMCD